MLDFKTACVPGFVLCSHLILLSDVGRRLPSIGHLRVSLDQDHRALLSHSNVRYGMQEWHQLSLPKPPYCHSPSPAEVSDPVSKPCQ